VAFTDDDVTVHAGWIDALVDSFGPDDGPDRPRRQVYPIGANMAFRRSLLRSTGEPFNPRLGHTGESTGTGARWWWRLPSRSCCELTTTSRAWAVDGPRSRRGASTGTSCEG
jgi:hypothetical protein